MIAWDKYNKHYWFCEAYLPNGKLCRAIKFKYDTAQAAQRDYNRHMAKVHNAN